MEYRVLARKYRPQTFADLIGQEALVRTLTNAIAMNRLAHAFLLTGIRGVGKTTTARIMARALNCIGPDGNGGPTITPCGVCTHCKMIAEDRHMDVLEVDAASRTGVDDIRELIDTVRYLPSTARTKVYIIDEVHMLSTHAFNALLKTLEEPPPSVTFIFATTELRKIPVTILSRCQRFDLRRVEVAAMAQHLSNIAGKEEIALEEAALQLLANAAEGSVRDGLSLLDQAISYHYTTDAKSAITQAEVREMLGLADRTHYLQVLQAALSGDAKTAIERLNALYAQGVDMILLCQELLELVHQMSKHKIAPDARASITGSESEHALLQECAENLSVAQLTRLWQMVLRSLQEARQTPQPLQAVEMLLIRMAYVSTLGEGDVMTPVEEKTTPAALPARPSRTANFQTEGALARSPQITPPAAIAAPAMAPALTLVSAQPAVQLADFAAVVALLEQHREGMLCAAMKHEAQVIAFAPGKIDLYIPADSPARSKIPHAEQFLSRWTGTAWKIALHPTAQHAQPTLAAQEAAARAQRIEQASTQPMVSALLQHFPGAKITDVTPTDHTHTL